ncbi:hypothetical protein LUZ60_016393 [Juncus effusus]|nr:hypothetical protein LUZ60_016393 [Juncus effusus]
MKKPITLEGLNDLNGTSSTAAGTSSAGGRRWGGPVPAAAHWVLITLLLAGLGVSVFVLAVVHNALLFVGIILISVIFIGFLVWNVVSYRSYRSLLIFLDRLPDSDLRTASDGQIVKISGIVSCGDISLISSYEKVGRCVYTSTLLYTCNGWISMLSNFSEHLIKWDLAHLERIAADFYITDSKSGIQALVKAGNNSKMIPLIKENILISTRDKNRELSLTMKKWLEERLLSIDSHLVKLEEGYIKEGRCITVMGILRKINGGLIIVPPQEPISTGCIIRNFLLPIDFDALILKMSDRSYFIPKFSVS